MSTDVMKPESGVIRFSDVHYVHAKQSDKVKEAVCRAKVADSERQLGARLIQELRRNGRKAIVKLTESVAYHAHFHCEEYRHTVDFFPLGKLDAPWMTAQPRSNIVAAIKTLKMMAGHTLRSAEISKDGPYQEGIHDAMTREAEALQLAVAALEHVIEEQEASPNESQAQG